MILFFRFPGLLFQSIRQVLVLTLLLYINKLLIYLKNFNFLSELKNIENKIIMIRLITNRNCHKTLVSVFKHNRLFFSKKDNKDDFFNNKDFK